MTNEKNEGVGRKINRVLPERVRRADARKEIKNILSTDDPVGAMKQWGFFHVPYEVMAGLKETLNEATEDPEKREVAFGRLLFFCVPTICKIVDKVKRLGVSDVDLTMEAFAEAADIVEKWKVLPPERRGKVKGRDFLRIQVNTEVKRKIHIEVAGRYGLEGSNLGTVRLYFQALEALLKNGEVEVDLETIKRKAGELVGDLGEEDRQVLFFGKRGKYRPRKFDLLAVVHHNCFGESGGELNNFPDEGSFNPEGESIKEDLKRVLHGLVSDLTLEEQKVLTWRYDQGNTMGEVAERMGFETPEEVLSIEAKALRKLRHPAKSRRLRDFLK